VRGGVAVVEIEQQRADPRPERRARSHALRRLGAGATPASIAATAEQFDPGHHRADRRQVDMVVAMTTPLPPGRQRLAAMRADLDQPPLGLGRRLNRRWIPANRSKQRLAGATQMIAARQLHPLVDSHSRPQRKPFPLTPRAITIDQQAKAA